MNVVKLIAFSNAIPTSIQQPIHTLTVWWSTFPVSSDNKFCYFCFQYNVVDNEVHFVWECPLYNLIIDKFPLLFENVGLGSLISFHQVDISHDVLSAH
jgi:hypothetical protein